MNVILLIVAIIIFVLTGFEVSLTLDKYELISQPFGLAFLAASFLPFEKLK